MSESNQIHEVSKPTLEQIAEADTRDLLSHLVLAPTIEAMKIGLEIAFIRGANYGNATVNNSFKEVTSEKLFNRS